MAELFAGTISAGYVALFVHTTLHLVCAANFASQAAAAAAGLCRALTCLCRLDNVAQLLLPGGTCPTAATMPKAAYWQSQCIRQLERPVTMGVGAVASRLHAAPAAGEATVAAAMQDLLEVGSAPVHLNIALTLLGALLLQSPATQTCSRKPLLHFS